MVALETALRQVGSLAQRADRDTLPEIRHTLRDLRQTLEPLQVSLAGDSPLLQEARQALRGVAEAVRSIKALADGLDRNPEALLRGRKASKP